MIKERLDYLNIQWLDPCKKPTTFISETPEDNILLQQDRALGRYDQIRDRMIWVRRVDLRLVHLADFLIVYLDQDTPTVGTIEEITWANQEKKPILIHYAQGKTKAPLWLFGMIPHQMIFSSWVELQQYLAYVDHETCLVPDSITPWSDNRWHLFSFHGDQNGMCTM
jgi:hypothetical protein